MIKVFNQEQNKLINALLKNKKPNQVIINYDLNLLSNYLQILLIKDRVVKQKLNVQVTKLSKNQIQHYLQELSINIPLPNKLKQTKFRRFILSKHQKISIIVTNIVGIGLTIEKQENKMRYLASKYVVTACPLNCRAIHNENQVVVNIGLDLGEDGLQDENEQPEDILQNLQKLDQFDISLHTNICKQKLQLLNSIINNKEKGIILFLDDIDSRNIQLAFDIVRGEKIKSLKVKFIQVFHKFKKADLHRLFNQIQDLPNLESLEYSNIDDMIANDPNRLKIPLFLSKQNGSFSRLKVLTINSTLMQMNYETLQNLEQAMIGTQGESQLIEFNLDTTECGFDQKSFRYINNILYHNRNSIQNMTIKIAETDFKMINPMNELSRSIEEMTQLKSIFMQLNLIQSEFEQVNTNLQKLFQGIARCKSQILEAITMVFLNVYVMSCSQIGQSIARIPLVSYLGPITHPQAIEMGIALGNSNKLKFIKVFSESDEIALMLNYILHFSKTLLNVQIDYQGNRLLPYKDISAGIASNQSIEELYISSSTSKASDLSSLFHLGKSIKTNKTIRKCTVMYDGKGHNEFINQFFQIISESQSLEQIQLDFTLENRFDLINLDIIIQSLCNIKTLQLFDMNLNPNIKKRVNFIQYQFNIYYRVFYSFQ